MKNKKGFTLVELLAVVLLVALLMLIGIPAIMRYMKQGTRSYYRSLEKEMKVAGMDYMESYRTLLPRQIDHVSVVELDELVNNKYIDPVVDEKGNACTGQVAVKKLKNNKYEYHSCLICSDYYSSEEQECDFDESKNEYADSALYSIKTKEGPFRVKQFSEFTAPYADVYYNNQLIKDDLEGKPKKLDTTKIGFYEVKYFYHGATGVITVEVYDDTEPSQTQVVLKYENKNGKVYKENWYSGNIYAEYKATDYSKKGIVGSGIAYYETKTENGEWTKIDSNNELIQLEGNYKRYVRAVDKAGKVGKANSYTIKIDKTPPSCVWSGEAVQTNGVWNWTKGTRNITATCNEIVGSGCANDYTNHTYPYDKTTVTKTENASNVIRDKAGNKGDNSCTRTLNVYVDTTPPVASAGNLNLGENGYRFINHVTRSDAHSGIASESCTPATSNISKGTDKPTCTIVDKVGNIRVISFNVYYSYAAAPSEEYDSTCCGTEAGQPIVCEARNCGNWYSWAGGTEQRQDCDMYCDGVYRGTCGNRKVLATDKTYGDCVYTPRVAKKCTVYRCNKPNSSLTGKAGGETKSCSAATCKYY